MRLRRVLLCVLSVSLVAARPAAEQPTVAPGPGEPDWKVILETMYGLKMIADLENPVVSSVDAVSGTFRKAGDGPVVYTPVIALGLETINRGGWYQRKQGTDDIQLHELWSYQFKNTTLDIENQTNLPPPLSKESKTEFDPGAAPFGLWVANDGLKDGGVFTEPKYVRTRNARLAKQPYKAMIYRLKDKATGKVIPHSYLIGWEYSTNDDFQDVVCRVDNVELVPETK